MKKSESLTDLGRFSEPALLILVSLAEGPKHGHAILLDIEALTGQRLGPGTLYGAIARLEERALIRGRWVEKAGQRRRRYYRITDNGRAMLATQREDWARFIAALTQIAGVTPA